MSKHLDEKKAWAIIKSVMNVKDSEGSKLAWNAAQQVCREAKTLQQEAVREAKKGVNISDTKPMTQEERELYAASILDGALRSGEMSITELDRFKSELGLEAKSQDISISIIDFKDVYPEEADVYATTAEIIKRKVREANEELRNQNTN